MNADEIRKGMERVNAEMHDMRGIEWALLEIAAQLAELNERENARKLTEAR